MKSIKKFFAMSALAALSIIYFTGCAKPVEELPTTPSTNLSLPTTDREGNEVAIPTEINRIISTAPSNTEILVALGLSDKLVAIDSYSGDIVGVPDGIELVNFRNADAEALVNMAPDILIASGHNKAGSEDPYALLKEAGICVVYLPTSSSIEGIYEDIRFLAAITDTTDLADQLIADLETRVAVVAEKAAQVTTPKKVYFEIAPAPSMFSPGADTFLTEFIETAGAINIFADQEPWFSPSPEAIIEANPDVIITNSDYLEDATGEIKSREGWDVISAVANDNVYLVNGNRSSRASHLSIEALEEIARLIYPELYE